MGHKISGGWNREDVQALLHSWCCLSWHVYIYIYLYKQIFIWFQKNRSQCIIAKLWGHQLSTSAKSFFGLYLVFIGDWCINPDGLINTYLKGHNSIYSRVFSKASKLMILQGGKSGQGLSCAYTFDALLPTGFCLTCTYNGGVGWGGADNIQVTSKTDLRIHKTKGWGGVGWCQGSTYRTKNNKCRSFPPALPLHTYTRVLPTTWLLMMFVHYPPLPQITNTRFGHVFSPKKVTYYGVQTRSLSRTWKLMLFVAFSFNDQLYNYNLFIP